MNNEVFIKHSKKEQKGSVSNVEILDEKRLAGGQRGTVFTVKVKIENRERIMILKRFQPGMNRWTRKEETANDRAQAAFKNYGLAKSLGLKVFSTYRISEKGESILMTNGDMEDWWCIGTNDESPDLIEKGVGKIEEISNFDSLIEEMYKDVSKAVEAEQLVLYDTYMFLVNKKDRSRVDFVLGDLDNLIPAKESGRELEKGKIFEINWRAVLDALKTFIERNLSESKNNYFVEKIDQYRERKYVTKQI